MSVVINHIYHGKLLDDELEEVMTDFAHVDVGDVMQQELLRFATFVKQAMQDVNVDCAFVLSHEGGMTRVGFTIVNPLNNELFLAVQLAQGVEESAMKLEHDFVLSKYVNVFQHVTKESTSALRFFPWKSVRDNLYTYLRDISKVPFFPGALLFGANSPYLHFNDKEKGMFSAVRRWTSEDKRDEFNVTVQIHIPSKAVAEPSNELFEEMRHAVMN